MEVAVCQVLSSRMRVILGKRTEMPAAVWMSDLVNSLPVISHTGDFLGSCKGESIRPGNLSQDDQSNRTAQYRVGTGLSDWFVGIC